MCMCLLVFRHISVSLVPLSVSFPCPAVLQVQEEVLGALDFMQVFSRPSDANPPHCSAIPSHHPVRVWCPRDEIQTLPLHPTREGQHFVDRPQWLVNHILTNAILEFRAPDLLRHRLLRALFLTQLRCLKRSGYRRRYRRRQQTLGHRRSGMDLLVWRKSAMTVGLPALQIRTLILV